MKLRFFLLLLSLIFFLFFVMLKISSLKINQIQEAKNISNVLGFDSNNKPSIYTPVLVGEENPPSITAQSILIYSLNSDTILYEKNSDLKLLPASTAKIVTALKAMEYYPLDKILEVNEISVEGQKMKLKKGEEISVRDLLYGLLVFSANDAAETLAVNYPGGKENFVSAMNLKASELGLRNTNFENPQGLDGINQYTTSKDLLILTKYALERPLFADIVKTKYYNVLDFDGTIKHKLVNINELLGDVDGVAGVKTGWTENARENLITYIDRENRKIIVIILGSEDRFGETKMLINWVYNNFIWQEI